MKHTLLHAIMDSKETKDIIYISMIYINVILRSFGKFQQQNYHK